MASNRKTAAVLLAVLLFLGGSGLVLADWDTAPTGACKECLVAQGAGRASLPLTNFGTFPRRFVLRARATAKATSVTLGITATTGTPLKNCAIANQTSPQSSGPNVAKVSCEIEIPAGQSIVIAAIAGNAVTEDVELVAIPRSE